MLTAKDRYYLTLARSVALGSKCSRARYGTVIVHRDGHIISTGYNGKPAGSTNDHICYREGLPDNAAKPNCCLHSEANALLFAGVVQTTGATVYVSGVPCTDCILLMA